MSDVGGFTDWVVPCDGNRKRCTNLVLASQGFQCMTNNNKACCLHGNGTKCKPVGKGEDEKAPDSWTGKDLVAGECLPG